MSCLAGRWLDTVALGLGKEGWVMGWVWQLPISSPPPSISLALSTNTASPLLQFATKNETKKANIVFKFIMISTPMINLYNSFDLMFNMLQR